MLRKVLVALLLAFGSVALACDSWRTEWGMEHRTGTFGVLPYLDLRCNIAVPPLTLEHEGETIVAAWLSPEAYLTPNVEWMWARLELLMDMPWPGQFGTSVRVGVSEPLRLAVFYRHSF